MKFDWFGAIRSAFFSVPLSMVYICEGRKWCLQFILWNESSFCASNVCKGGLFCCLSETLDTPSYSVLFSLKESMAAFFPNVHYILPFLFVNTCCYVCLQHILIAFSLIYCSSILSLCEIRVVWKLVFTTELKNKWSLQLFISQMIFFVCFVFLELYFCISNLWKNKSQSLKIVLLICFVFQKFEIQSCKSKKQN